MTTEHSAEKASEKRASEKFLQRELHTQSGILYESKIKTYGDLRELEGKMEECCSVEILEYKQQYSDLIKELGI